MAANFGLQRPQSSEVDEDGAPQSLLRTCAAQSSSSGESKCAFNDVIDSEDLREVQQTVADEIISHAVEGGAAKITGSTASDSPPARAPDFADAVPTTPSSATPVRESWGWRARP